MREAEELRLHIPSRGKITYFAVKAIVKVLKVKLECKKIDVCGDGVGRMWVVSG